MTEAQERMALMTDLPAPDYSWLTPGVYLVAFLVVVAVFAVIAGVVILRERRRGASDVRRDAQDEQRGI